MPKHTVLTIRDLAEGTRVPRTGLLDGEGQVTEPALIVDLDPSCTEADVRRAAEQARTSHRLLIGTRNGVWSSHLDPVAVALDLTLTADEEIPRCAVTVPDPEGAVALLLENVQRAPQTALVLGRLLRIGESLSVWDALDLESLAYSTLLSGPAFARWLSARGVRRPRSSAGDGEAVTIRREAAALYLTLNRPDRRNAYSCELRDALVAGLTIARLDESIAEVVLDAQGPSFCSGGDLDEFGTATDPATAHFIRTLAGAARSVHALRDQVTVLLHGHCVGAGIEVPAFASRVVADPGSVIRLPELSMGLIPGAGGTVSISRRIGRWRTEYLVLSGVPIMADQACAWGLVDRVEAVRHG